MTRAIENAQKKVEAHNFDIRKHLLEYDDVLNKQREVIYNQRREALKGEDLKQEVLKMADDLASDIVTDTRDKDSHPADWDPPVSVKGSTISSICVSMRPYRKRT